MASVAATLENLKQSTQAAVRLSKESAKSVGESIKRPKKLQAAADGATRTGQIIALFMLGPVIVVNLTIIEVVHLLMADVILGADLGDQLPILSFLITFITLGLLVVCAWGWFQFVRTAGFGGFSFD